MVEQTSVDSFFLNRGKGGEGLVVFLKVSWQGKGADIHLLYNRGIVLYVCRSLGSGWIK